jgi:cytochrome c-type biogenesis protein CcmH/NrfG
MGWLIFVALAGGALAALWRLAGLGRAGLQLVAAALLLAGAGYAWQGRPGLAGSPRAAADRPSVPETLFMALRRDMFGRFDSADLWLNLAEGYSRRGDTAGAAAMIRSGLRARPGNAVLWTGYGDALAVHGGGLLSPASEFAFRRAVALAPNHPAPLIFYGARLAENDRLEQAAQAFRRALALTPPSAPWRPGLQRQVELLERARTAPREQPKAPPARL